MLFGECKYQLNQELEESTYTPLCAVITIPNHGLQRHIENPACNQIRNILQQITPQITLYYLSEKKIVGVTYID